MATNLANWHNFIKKEIEPEKQVISSVAQTTPEITNVQDIWNAASKLRISLNPLDIREVVEKIFRIKLMERDLGRTASGFLEQINDDWYIVVNKYESETRKRFTIAHELGHYIHHRKEYLNGDGFQKDLIFFRDENTNPIEREANDFASDLLMPEHIFKRYIQDGDNTISALADKFHLSTPAVKYRAYKLGLISEYK